MRDNYISVGGFPKYIEGNYRSDMGDGKVKKV